MENIEQIRHSLAHLLASAVLEFYPKTKLGIGPAIENGFYYDMALPKEFKPEDLPKIEARMRELIKENQEFVGKKVSKITAKKLFAKQPYKLELIKDLKEGTLTTYQNGAFLDLCRGGHVENTKEIDLNSFKLTKIAGAYWKGSEKNAMLTRIYGVAFENAVKLQEYLNMQEEAEKRDHRVLGQKLGLFMFHETAPGMPYWLPKGLSLYNELVNFWRKEHVALNYQEISSPLVNKAELWHTSGHWEHYKEDMFIANMGENEIYGIKPMNCPNAMVVFNSMQVSYKDLPLRLSDTDKLHRYERSGTLNGLLRVRAFQQDDSHNFISEDMIASEYNHIFDICKNFYGIFGLTYSFRLGTRPEKFLGEKATWDKAEAELKKILEKSGVPYTVKEGDGAFYGPKVDIVMKDSLGRDWQMGTIQLDFQLPQRFHLNYIGQDGTKKTPVVVHRVIYGSLERFIGILIEHTAGAFPLWLSPVQIAVIPISEKHVEYAKQVAGRLQVAGCRLQVMDENESLGKKIREAEMQKIPYLLIMGDKEIAANSVGVRQRGKGDLGAMAFEAFLEKIAQEIKEKK